jgi:GntP family gluconate:H+ symporter
MTGGLIVLVTAGGGAFGAMLREAGLQQSVQGWLGPDREGLGVTILLLAFGVTGLIKFAQGSGTVAMITTASMFASMGLTSDALGFHLVYLATAIGSGALLFDWMNNSAFWIFSRMSGLTEVETLKTWSIITSVVGLASMTMTLTYSLLFPLL